MGQTKIKRLFLDLETSPNLVYSWRTGSKIFISHDSIVKERAIICIGYKWQGKKEVHALQWDTKGNDRKILQEFIPILESADEIVAHNGDHFDIPWLRARAAFHGLQISAYLKTIDTLQQSRRVFYFNSNKLDYLGEFLGFGKKIKTDFDLWKNVMAGDSKALKDMITYCRRDVDLLEKVYLKLESFNKPKTHAGVLEGKGKGTCPTCASEKTQRRGYRLTALGVKSQIMSCNSCGRNFTVSMRWI